MLLPPVVILAPQLHTSRCCVVTCHFAKPCRPAAPKPCQHAPRALFKCVLEPCRPAGVGPQPAGHCGLQGQQGPISSSGSTRVGLPKLQVCFVFVVLSCFQLCLRHTHNSDTSDSYLSLFLYRRFDYPASEVPQQYSCFCGKKEDPEWDPWLAPHSCGELCGK